MADEPSTPTPPRAPSAYASAVAFWGALGVLGMAIVIAGGWAWSSRPARARDASSAVVTQILPAPPEPKSAMSEPPAHALPALVRAKESPSDSPTTERAESPRTILDLNTATAAELELLPGVGPALAARIIDHRKRLGSFKRVDDLDKVRGIGEKTLARIRPHVRVGDR